jgi:hypothetical protein
MRVFTKLLLAVALIFLILLNYSQFKVFTYNDISIEPINKSINPDLNAKQHKERLPVYLISYADGQEVFYKNQNALILSALNKGADIFINYRKSMIDREFYQQNKYILEQKRGAGYWIWKPYIILKTMQEAPEGAKIIYADSGFVFVKPLTPYLEKLDKHDILLVKYPKKIEGTVRNIARSKVLQKIGCTTKSCLNGYTSPAGFIAVKNTPIARAFIKKWLSYCCEQDLIIDNPDDTNNHDFKQHRDDQTILSTLASTGRYPIYYYPNKPFEKEVDWHHRNKNHLKYNSTIPSMRKSIKRIERRYIKGDWAVRIKRWLLGDPNSS